MHYKNGREAKIGDPVVGTGYNYGTVAGTLLSITPASESCNCMIGTLTLVPLEKATMPVVGFQGSEAHGSAGERYATIYRIEYSQGDYLLHAEDAMKTS